MKRSHEPDDEFPEYYCSTPPGDSGLGSPTPSCSSQPSSSTAAPSSTPPPAVKIVRLGPISPVAVQERSAMKCSLPPHKEGLSFPSYEEYEVHYHKAHTNRCLECRKNFPSEYILGLHIEECHDSFAAVRRERNEHTYSCFVEECERKCLTPQKRRLHMIDKHGYPRNYFFALTKEGIDGRRSLLLEGGHRRRSSSNAQVSPRAAKDRRMSSTIQENSGVPVKEAMMIDKGKGPSPNMKESENRPDTEMEDLATGMSSLQFVPTSIRFGRGGGRAGFATKRVT